MEKSTRIASHYRIPDPWKMTKAEFLRGEPKPKARSGWTLLYHSTYASPEIAESIARNGILTRYSKSPPAGTIWASPKPDSFYESKSGTLVIFQVPSRGTPADKEPGNAVFWDTGSSVVIARDIPPEDIVLIDPVIQTEEHGTERLSHFRDPEYAEIYWEEAFAKGSKMKTARTLLLNEAGVESLRKDLLMLLKNVPRVKTYQDAEVLKRALLKWRARYETFGLQIRADLEGRIRENKNKPDWEQKADPAWAQYFLDHMEPFWKLEYAMNTMPFQFTDPETVRYYPEESRLYEFAKKGEAWANTTRAKARDAWKYLTSLYEWTAREGRSGGGGDAIPLITFDDERVQLEGFNLIFRGFDHSRDAADKLENLKEALKRYRQRAMAVLPVMIQKQLPMIVDWSWDENPNQNAAGLYERTYIRITPWALGSKDIDDTVHVFAHEMGHHLFHMMSRDSQTFWAKAIRADAEKLDLREAAVEMKAAGAGYFTDKKLAMHNPVLFIQLQTLAYNQAYKHLDLWNLESIETYLEKGGDPMVFAPVSPISGYASKNSDEAFSEAVGFLVGYGPRRLPPMVRSWLQVLFPNIKMAARIAARYSRSVQ